MILFFVSLETHKMSYNLRPRKPEEPPAPADASTIKTPKATKNMDLATENMDLATQNLYDTIKLKVNGLLDSIRTETDRTKKILRMELLKNCMILLFNTAITIQF